MSVVFSWENTRAEEEALRSFRQLQSDFHLKGSSGKSAKLQLVCTDKNRLINFSCSVEERRFSSRAFVKSLWFVPCVIYYSNGR